MPIRKSLIAVGCLMMSFAGFAQSEAQSQPPMMPSRTAEIVLSDQDKDFFASAASAGQLEVQAGKLADSDTQNTSIKNFAEMMVKDHSTLNEELQKLALSKNVDLPTSMNDKDSDQLQALQKAANGKDFDKEYLKSQVKAHKAAVDLFDNAARNSKDADIRAFTAKALPLLQKHGAEAKTLDKKY